MTAATEYYHLRADKLAPGDMVDLEGDPFFPADKWPQFEFENAIAWHCVRETENCVLVYFLDSGSDFAAGFPPDHLFKVVSRGHDVPPFEVE